MKTEATTTTNLQALLSAVPRLTRAQADAIVADGMELRHLAAASASELKSEYGIPLPVAVDLRAAARAALTSADAGPADAVALSAHLAALSSGDPARVTAALDALEARGFVAIPVDERSMPSVAAAQEVACASASAVVEALRVGHWRGARLVRTSDLRPRPYQPHSPTTKAELQGNGPAAADPRTGVLWGRLDPVDLGLAHIAVDERLTGGLSDQALLDDIAKHGSAWHRARAFADAHAVDRATADRQLHKRAQSAQQAASSTEPSSSQAQVERYATDGRLDSLLLRLFSAEEMRRFVRFNIAEGQRILDSIGATAPAALAADIADRLKKWGYTADPNFWTALCRERPRREDEIRALQRAVRP